jgi:hypothetical protein
MRFFALVDFKYMMLAVFLGLISLILVYMAWGSYPSHRTPTDEEELRRLRGHEIQTGHDAEHNPVAPFLIFIYIGIGIWVVAYMIFVGIRGGPVGY